MNKIAVIGGGRKFIEFLKLTGADVVVTASASEAIADDEINALILLPEYDKGCETVKQLSLEDMEVLAKRKRNGFRVYAENYLSYNTYNVSVFGCEVIGKICHINNESLCAQNGLQYIMGGERILQAAGAAYLPAIAKLTDPYVLEKRILLSKGHYVGTSQIAHNNVPDSLPVLIQSGSVYTALISLSEFDSVNLRPNYRWKKIYGHVFSFILNIDAKEVETAFEKCFPPLKTRMQLHSKIEENNWSDLCSHALYDAVKWHFDSGIILGENGVKGAVEMIMSNNGQDLYCNRRVDAGMYTGWLLYAAGKHFNREEWMLTGENVFRYFAENAQLEGGRQDGLYTWYYNKDAGPHDIYSIDCGRDGIALCNMYKLTGNESYLKRIHRLADGFVNWMNGDLLYSNYMRYEEPLSDKPYIPGGSTCTPAVYAEMVSFMVMASHLTGERKYLDVVLKIADKMVQAYPDYEYYGHTTSSRNARLLLLLLCIHVTGERDYSCLINKLIDYLSSIQLPCGGIYSEDNITFERNINVNSESGITAPWENDRISDQLYCVNNTLAALSVLKQVPEDSDINKTKGMAMFRRLLEYIVKIQIVSEDKRFQGGWMRAYSMTHEEYYGLDLDKFWGSYCIMAGWTMGILPLALLSELTDECPYI